MRRRSQRSAVVDGNDSLSTEEGGCCHKIARLANKYTLATTMMIKAVLSIVALSYFARAEDLLRHRKERYVIPELDSKTASQELEDERDRLRHEVARYWTRILQVSVPIPLSLDVSSIDVPSLEPFSISTIDPFSIATIDPFGGTPTTSPTKAPTKTPTSSPTQKPTMLPSIPPTVEPTVGGIIELDIDDDFKVECSGKAGKMTGGKMIGGKMITVSPSPSFSPAPIDVECSGKHGKMQGVKMSPISTLSTPAFDASDFEGQNGKMYGGKMYGTPTVSPAPYSDYSVSTGKMYGGKMYGGKMYGTPTASPASFSVVEILEDLAATSSPAPIGKMYGGKMYGGKMHVTSTTPPMHPGVEILDDFGPTVSPAPGGKMYDGKMYGGKMYDGKMYDGKMYDGKMYDGKMYDGKMYDGKMYGSTTASPASTPLNSVVDLAVDTEFAPSGKNGGKMTRALR